MASEQVSVDLDMLTRPIMCWAETIYRVNGIWEGPDPLTPVISSYLFQLVFTLTATRILSFLLRPFNQPAFVAELLAGILSGPSAFGKIDKFRKTLFPNYSFRSLEPMAHFALLIYAFLVGLKMDMRTILQGAGSKPMMVAAAGIMIPFIMGTSLYFMFSPNFKIGFLFWAGALSISGTSVLTYILNKQKLLHSEIGKTTVASSAITEAFGWAMLTFAYSVTSSDKLQTIAYSLITTFVVMPFLLLYVVRRMLKWVIKRRPEGQGYNEFYLCSVFMGVFFCGMLADAFGVHPMIGSFLYGLVIPNEVLQSTMLERLEDLVMGMLMPVFFMVCGLRTNFDVIEDQAWRASLAIVIAWLAKPISCFILCHFSNELPRNEVLPVGVLNNAKSTLALIILEAGSAQGVLDSRTYAVMMASLILMTTTATPAAILFRPVKVVLPYKRRTIQKSKPDHELRILTCIYTNSNISTTMNILRVSNPTKRSPISVFAMQLIELVGRATTLLMVHEKRQGGASKNLSHIEAQASQIINAFDSYEVKTENVKTQTMTARTSYSVMYEYICNAALDKRTSIIILPFHKLPTAEGEMEDINPVLRTVNEAVLTNAPCSVGVLVDRGLVDSFEHACNIAVLFFGGADDREALAYAWRMADNQNVTLTVVRFMHSTDAVEEVEPDEKHLEENHIALCIDDQREKIVDADYLDKFQTATADSNNIRYYELVLHDEEETIKAIKSMDEHNYDLYMVGRSLKMTSPLTAGLADWCDCPELGPIGDLLITSEFESKFMVLILQQYVKRTGSSEGSITTSSISNFAEEAKPLEPDAFGSFSSFKKDYDDNYMDRS